MLKKVVALLDNLILNRDKEVIIKLTRIAQTLISQLHIQDPDNETFEQEGIINGQSIVKDYIDEGEYAIAIEHLLYMVYESDISYPAEMLVELNTLASKYNVKCFYVSE